MSDYNVHKESTILKFIDDMYSSGECRAQIWIYIRDTYNLKFSETYKIFQIYDRISIRISKIDKLLDE